MCFATLGCTQSTDYQRVAGVKGLFCVPKGRQVHLPFGMFETDNKTSSGFAFTGCTGNVSTEKRCRVPREITSGVVAPLEMRVHWRWQDFSDNAYYHRVLNDLSSANIEQVTVFDDGRMLRVVLRPPENTVFFWSRSNGRFSSTNTALTTDDKLIAVCAHSETDNSRSGVKFSGLSCDRYTSAEQYALKYKFNIADMSVDSVRKLDSGLVNVVDSWKCSNN